MTPTQASDKANEDIVRDNLYDEKPVSGRIKFHVNDRVRIAKKKSTFEKGYTPNWTEEVFTVTEVLRTSPVTYKIKDWHGDDVEGSFYEQELQKTTQDVYRIEKVIKKTKDKALVKWKGYPQIFNSWIPICEIMSLT